MGHLAAVICCSYVNMHELGGLLNWVAYSLMEIDHAGLR